MDYGARLREASGFDEVFQLVKKGVEDVLGQRRAGLSLVLAGLPGHVGAYHALGSNAIVMNRNLVEVVRKFAASKEEYNSFVFTILAHEYLHSLGYTDEVEVRCLDHEMCKTLFGEGHPATRMSTGRIWSMYPQLHSLGFTGPTGEFEIVSKFDSSSTTYIG